MGKGGQTLGQVNNEVLLQETQLEKNEEVIVKTRREKRIEESPFFYWNNDEEPHQRRRAAIIAAHPEIRKLYGPDDSIKYFVMISIVGQLFSIHLLHDAPFITWLFCCYTLSGTVNHCMTLAMHELSHNLGSRKPRLNRIYGIMTNFAIGLPAFTSFRKYHLDHHRYQGEDILDTDVPSEVEGWFFKTTPRKTLWMLLQPLFYALRPMFMNQKDVTMWDVINYAVVIMYQSTVFYFYGGRGVLYLIVGTLFGMGIHPVAGHFVAEHYVMNEGQETYSYYGPLNWFTFNVGYHNEHHDFPFVTGRNLPEIRKIAPEFYDDIPHYHSWSKVIYDFIIDVKINPYSRVKRITKE